MIMYELATGRLPFVGQTTVELYNRIIHDDPVPLTKVKPQLTKALETVCLKAMAKDPDDRYPTAAEFADDLLALLGGGTVAAKADSALVKWFKRVRKRGSIPVLVGVAAVLLISVLGTIFYVHTKSQREHHEQQVAAELKTVQDAVEGADRKTAELLARGRAALRTQKLPIALEAARELLAVQDELDQRFGGLTYPQENGPRSRRWRTTPTRRACSRGPTR